MRLSIALTILSAAKAQEYARINKLRGADLSTDTKNRSNTDGSQRGAGAATKLELAVKKLSVGDDAADLAECTPHTTPDECNSDKCTWCVSGAVGSACYPSGMTGRLPKGVFECASNTAKFERIEDHLSHIAIVDEAKKMAAKVLDKKIMPEFFNLKQGITLTLTSDVVDKNFCDPNSDVGLAGYMNVKGSQFDTNNDKNLFFWMFEKRTTSLLPSNDNLSFKAESFVSDDDTPLIVWLTGGPGCSSSLALLTENGPCSVNEDGETTSVNPYSWTESAHVLWLDQPADVGYSYGQNNDYNEEMISEDAYYFLQAFFQSEVGHQYKNNPLFIVGESYGGHYAPAIAHRIWRGNKDAVQNGLASLNLKGLAIGNGLTNPEIQYQYYAEMAYKNSHNIQAIDESTYNQMKAAEPGCIASIHACNSGEDMATDTTCQDAFSQCNNDLHVPYEETGLNPYDIRKPCGDNPLCYDFSHVEKFMNSDVTKKTLHVDSHNPTWQTCNMNVGSFFHSDWMKDFSGYVADLLNDDIPALIYAGDVDFICNYLGNKAWTTELEWKNGNDFRAAEDHDWNNGAGLAKTAGKLTFLQVYDAGHMVPTDQPEHALTMITQFLNGVPF